jgi:hypothetical protein
MCNGAITITVTTEDGTEYTAIDCGMDGTTNYFSVKPKDQGRILRMVRDDSHFAMSTISKLVSYALKHHKEQDNLDNTVKRLEDSF